MQHHDSIAGFGHACLTVAAGLLLAGSAFAQCTGTPTYQETFVDPEFTQCPAVIVRGWHGSAWGGGGGAADTFDQDANYGAVAGMNEDADADNVCGSIQSAINSTLTGGTVHVLVPGLYREALTISRSMTIRGGEGMDVILSGSLGNCSGGPAAGPGISITASNADVRLENLTVHAYAIGGGVGDGIRITGSSTSVTVNDCRILENEGDGIAHVGGGDTKLHVIGSEIAFNDNGISQQGATAELTLVDTVVAGNANDGVTGPGETGWGIMTIDGSQIDGNGRHGIHLSQNLQSIGGSLVLHDSGVSHNATNGLSATITNGSAVTLISASETLFGSNGADGIHLSGGSSHLISLRGCRINQNIGDGIEVGSTWTLNIMDNMFATNGAFCINNAATTPVTCNPGLNQFVPLPGTCMANTPPGGPCGLSPTALNH